MVARRKLILLCLAGIGGALAGGLWKWLAYPEAFENVTAVPSQLKPVAVTSAQSPGMARIDPAFRSCAACHQVGKNARNAAGPVLNDVLGRKAGSTDYAYSRAMRESDAVWTEENLRAFIRRPQSIVPGTRMAFGGLPDAKIDAIIEFLKKRERE